MAKTAKQAKQLKQSKSEQHVLYWPHLFFVAFGAFVAWCGASSVDGSIRSYQLGYGDSDWIGGTIVAILGGVLIGAALTKMSDVYRNRATGHVKPAKGKK